MKIVFDKLESSSDKIQVSFDGGTTYKDYVISDVK